MRKVSSVEDIVLQHEEDVKDNREETQPKLGGVTKQRTPVIIVVSYEEHLHHAECATCEVKQDIANAPTHCALPLVVHESLRDIFDESDAQLDIGAVGEEGQPVDNTGQSEYQSDGNKDANAGQDSITHFGHRLVGSLKTSHKDEAKIVF